FIVAGSSRRSEKSFVSWPLPIRNASAAGYWLLSTLISYICSFSFSYTLMVFPSETTRLPLGASYDQLILPGFWKTTLPVETLVTFCTLMVYVCLKLARNVLVES